MSRFTKIKYWKTRSKVIKLRYFFLKYFIALRYSFFNSLHRRKPYAKILLYLLFSIVFLFTLNDAFFYLSNMYEFNIFEVNLFDVFESNVTDSLIAMIAGFISLVGIFLGLYYTSVGSIYSLHYNKTSADINTHFVKKTFNNIQSMILILILNIVLITTILFGNEVYILTFITVLLLNIFSAAIYYSAYMKSLRFANLYNVDSDFNRLIIKSIKTLRFKNRLLSTDIAFQQLVLKVVLRLLQNKNNININLTSDNPNQNDLGVILNNNISLLYQYSVIKKDVPTSSNWFYSVDKYRSWFVSNEFTEVAMALNTGTTIRTERVQDHLWFEKLVQNQCFDIVQKINCDNQKLIHYYLTYYFQVVANTATSDNIDFWLEQLNSLGNIIKTNFNNNIELTSIWISGFTELILSLTRSANNLSLEKYMNSFNLGFNNSFQNINSKKSIINTKNWNAFIDKLVLERKVEKKLITPLWFVKGIVRNHIISVLNEKSLITKKITDFYESSLDSIINSSDNNAVVAIMSSNEFDNKVIYLDNVISNKATEISELQANKYFDLEYKDSIMIDQYLNRKKRINIDFYEKLFKINKENNTELPDYIGYSYYNLVNISFKQVLMDSCDDIVLKSISILLSNLTLIVSNIVKETSDDKNYMLRKITQPYVYIGIIMGMCLYDCVLNNNTAKEGEIVTKLNEYFKHSTEGSSRVQAFNAMLKYAQTTSFSYGISDQYEHDFVYKIKQNPLIKYKTEFYGNQLDTGIELIDDFGLSSDIFGFDGDLIDIFIVRYFNKLLVSDQIIPKKGWAKKNVY